MLNMIPRRPLVTPFPHATSEVAAKRQRTKPQATSDQTANGWWSEAAMANSTGEPTADNLTL
jgi:hypothetical protein